MIEVLADGAYYPMVFTVDHSNGNTVILHDGDIILSVTRNQEFGCAWDYVVLRRVTVGEGEKS